MWCVCLKKHGHSRALKMLTNSIEGYVWCVLLCRVEVWRPRMLVNSTPQNKLVSVKDATEEAVTEEDRK